jgi:hypothetical protein
MSIPSSHRPLLDAGNDTELDGSVSTYSLDIGVSGWL